MYADYDYYRTLYGGKLSEEEYTFAAARASEYLASVTHDRITEDILADDTTSRNSGTARPPKRWATIPCRMPTAAQTRLPGRNGGMSWRTCICPGTA